MGVRARWLSSNVPKSRYHNDSMASNVHVDGSFGRSFIPCEQGRLGGQDGHVSDRIYQMQPVLSDYLHRG